MEQEQISRLLDKYLAGNCTPEEEQAVQNWLNSRPQQDQRWREMSGPAQQEYLAELFRDVRRTIGEEAGDEVPQISAHVNIQSGKTHRDHYGEPQATDATLMQSVASGNEADIIRRRSLRLTLRVAAIALVVLGASLLYLFRNSLVPEELHTVATAKQETKRILLPDSSVVVLNGSSKLSYAENWKDREVQLEGEAYFEVKASPEHPFVIRSGAVQTRVLGTRFNISAYPEDRRISVGVITGKVEVGKLKSADKVLVNSGEMAVYDKPADQISHEGTKERILVKSKELAVYDKQKDQIVHTETKDTAYNAWMEGRLNFYRTPLSDVAAALERTFGVNIHIRNSYEKECEINGRFHVNQSPAEILTIICKSINAECTIVGDEVTIDNSHSCY
jgi:ferric-dicitrate binding protein FerR (iron transport regulator)